MVDIEKIRNIGIIAHIDAGKTTTTEGILYYTDKEHKLGSVDQGTTVMDFMEDERDRGITIGSAATTCSWNGHDINIIDTPGHVDFTAEVERCLRVLDGAVGIFCAVGGVEAQSETVWRQADRYNIPRIAFVNKMDRSGADFDKALHAMRTRLKSIPVVITMPWGSENNFQGVIDVLQNKAYTFSQESKGKDVTEHSVPEELADKVKDYYEELVNSLADFDDDIIEKYSEDNLSIKDLKKSLRKETLAGRIIPVLAGASLRHKGIQCLLDAIIDYLPSPKDIPPILATNPKNKKQVKICYNDKHLCALVFKTTYDKHADLSYVRVYSGKISEGMQVFNPSTNKSERVNRLWKMHADERIKCQEIGSGQIAAIVGLRQAVTGDTLCKKNKPLVLESMDFPDTVIAKAIEPRAIADKDHLLDVLKILSKDDPTFRYNNDEEHGQIVISGMGELHLDIICNRILKDHNVKVNVGKPRVSYRETISNTAHASYLFDKQFGTKELYAYLKVQVAPDAGNLLISNDLSTEKVPAIYHSAIQDGVKSAITSGDLAGYPLINVSVKILDGQSHVTNSTEEAFYAAAFNATKDALSKAGYVLLEPIMKFQIQTPQSYVGDVISNIGCRRGEVEDMDLVGDVQIITGRVPIAEMFGYADKLRALTHGRGNYTMEPSEYARVPENVQKKVLNFGG